MDKVVATAKEIEAQQRKEMIFAFVEAILSFLPGVGQLIPGLRAIIRLLGNLAEAAVTIYDIVDSPASAGFAIFEALIGGKSRGSSRFIDASKKNRDMSSNDVDKLPPAVKAKRSKITSARSRGLCVL